MPMEPAHWQDAERRLLSVRRAALVNGSAIEASLMMLNGSVEDRAFRVPPTNNLHWALALDSSDPNRLPGGLESETVQVPSFKPLGVTWRKKHDGYPSWHAAPPTCSTFSSTVSPSQSTKISCTC